MFEPWKNIAWPFFKFSAVQVHEPVPNVASDCCSWLTGVELDMVFGKV